MIDVDAIRERAEKVSLARRKDGPPAYVVRIADDALALLDEVERQRIEGVELTVERDYFMRQATERLDENKRLRGLLETAATALASMDRCGRMVQRIRTELEATDE